MLKYSLLLLAILIGAIGQILLKIGVNQSLPQIGNVNSFKEIFLIIFIFLKNYWIVTAILLYALGLFVWLFILTKFELSYVFPLMASIYIFILLFSWIFLKENIDLLRIIGTILITIGIILIAKS